MPCYVMHTLHYGQEIIAKHEIMSTKGWSLIVCIFCTVTLQLLGQLVRQGCSRKCTIWLQSSEYCRDSV